MLLSIFPKCLRHHQLVDHFLLSLWYSAPPNCLLVHYREPISTRLLIAFWGILVGVHRHVPKAWKSSPNIRQKSMISLADCRDALQYILPVHPFPDIVRYILEIVARPANLLEAFPGSFTVLGVKPEGLKPLRCWADKCVIQAFRIKKPGGHPHRLFSWRWFYEGFQVVDSSVADKNLVHLVNVTERYRNYVYLP